MKKIEAVIDPAALEDVKLHLAEAGIDGRLTVAEVSALENLSRFYQLPTSDQNPWKLCLKIDLILTPCYELVCREKLQSKTPDFDR